MHRLRDRAVPVSVWAFVVMAAMTAHAQKFEVSALAGGRFGGSLKLEQQGQPNFHANIADSVIYGLAGGFVLDGDDCTACNVVGFRWMRASTHLEVPQDPLAPPGRASFRQDVTFDHFLADFSHEWPQEESGRFRPFVIGTLGAVRMGAPASSSTRFTFGIGAGFKLFPAPHWGLRFQAEYLPIVLHGELQTLVCAGGCVVVLNGGITSQFLVSIGPAVRF